MTKVLFAHLLDGGDHHTGIVVEEITEPTLVRAVLSKKDIVCFKSVECELPVELISAIENKASNRKRLLEEKWKQHSKLQKDKDIEKLQKDFKSLFGQTIDKDGNLL